MDTVKIKAKGVKMIAHRGLSGIERENTYPAFVAAANRSYYGSRRMYTKLRTAIL